MAVRQIEILAGLSPGLVLSIDGQTFAYTGDQPYTKVSGETVELHAWSARCQTCEAEFEALTGRNITYPSRRCRACRKPGSAAPTVTTTNN